jgi:hypothetical protein
VKKVCPRCGEDKDTQSFHRDRTRNNGRFPWCKTCVSEARSEARRVIHVGDGDRQCPVCERRLAENSRANRIYCSDRCKGRAGKLRTYGLEPEEYRALIVATGGLCPICKKRIKKWCIDHNHDTGETLGVVCVRCNTSLLAYTYHNAEIARNLADFLEKPPVVTLLGEKRYVGPQAISQLDRMWAWSGESGPPASDLCYTEHSPTDIEGDDEGTYQGGGL